MNELSFPSLEVVGYSTTTLAEAIRNALLLIDPSLPPPLWVEKVATQAVMAKGRVVGWHVVLKVGLAEETADEGQKEPHAPTIKTDRTILGKRPAPSSRNHLPHPR